MMGLRPLVLHPLLITKINKTEENESVRVLVEDLVNVITEKNRQPQDVKKRQEHQNVFINLTNRLHQLSRSHKSVTFTRVDTQDYDSDTCDSVSI